MRVFLRNYQNIVGCISMHITKWLTFNWALRFSHNLICNEVILHFIELWLKARTKNVYRHCCKRSLTSTSVVDQRGTKKFEETQMNLQGQPLHKHQKSLCQWIRSKVTRISSFCDFSNGVVYGYSILCRSH